MNNLHYLCNDLCTVDGSAERRRSHQGQEVVQRHVGCQGHLWPHERHLVRHPWGRPCLKCTHFITCMQKWKIRGNTLESEQAIVSIYLVQAPDCVCFLFPCFPDVRSYLKSWPCFSRSGSSPTLQDGMLFSAEMWVSLQGCRLFRLQCSVWWPRCCCTSVVGVGGLILMIVFQTGQVLFFFSPQGEFTSMGVYSTGNSYGVQKDLIYSFPVHIKVRWV